MDLRETMEKFWHDLAGQGDFYNRDGRTDKGDAYRQIAHDLSAALKKIKPPTPPEASDGERDVDDSMRRSMLGTPKQQAADAEREHCSRVASELAALSSTSFQAMKARAIVERERAAVRAECQAEIARLNAECDRLFQLCKVLGAQ